MMRKMSAWSGLWTSGAGRESLRQEVDMKVEMFLVYQEDSESERQR